MIAHSMGGDWTNHLRSCERCIEGMVKSLGKVKVEQDRMELLSLDCSKLQSKAVPRAQGSLFASVDWRPLQDRGKGVSKHGQNVEWSGSQQ